MTTEGTKFQLYEGRYAVMVSVFDS